jgi:hypothetical protein
MLSDEDKAELLAFIEEEKQWQRDKHKRFRDNIGSWSAYRSRHRDANIRPKPPVCEICSGHGKIVWDHCHRSNKFRGWICNKCNLILGAVKDDPVLLEKLAVYLRTHDVK